ncbi:MAG: PilZ domain-containing protein [Anaeromyxobacter sp.]
MASRADERIYRRFNVRVPLDVSSAGQLQVCETDDVGAGGCRAVVLFPMHRGDHVRVRLRSDRVDFEASGQAAVAWATREPPYRVGLQFSEPLVEQSGRFLQALLGPVMLRTDGTR